MAIKFAREFEGGKHVVIKEGAELFRADPDDDVWFSWHVEGAAGVMRVHVNPKPEEIQPDWFRAECQQPIT